MTVLYTRFCIVHRALCYLSHIILHLFLSTSDCRSPNNSSITLSQLPLQYTYFPPQVVAQSEMYSCCSKVLEQNDIACFGPYHTG